MQVAEGHGNLNCIEAGPVLRESSHLAQVHEELATSDESHDKENLLVCLEHVAHSNEEGMISLQKDVFLQPSRLDLIILNDDVLSERFHRVHLLASPLFNQKDLAEGAATNNRNDLEVGKSDVRVVLRIDKRRAMCDTLRYLVCEIVASSIVLRLVLLVSEWLIEIFGANSVALGWNLVLACLRVFLGSAVFLQCPRHAVDGHIVVL